MFPLKMKPPWLTHWCRYAENGSLAQTLKAFGKLNENLVASYVTKVLEGLHYLHSSEVRIRRVFSALTRVHPAGRRRRYIGCPL